METIIEQQNRVFSDFVIEEKDNGEWKLFEWIDYPPGDIPNAYAQMSDAIQHITRFLEQHLRPARLGFHTADEQYNPIRYRIRNLKSNYIYNLSLDDNGLIMLDFPNGNKLPTDIFCHR